MPEFTSPGLARVIDELDAFLFTSDAFQARANRRALAAYLERWEAELNLIENGPEEWTCPNCGTTDQDGSGICIDCGHTG